MEGEAPGVEGEVRPPDLRKDSRAWRTSGSSFGEWFIGIRRGGGDLGDTRRRSRMSWKSADAESRGGAPGLDCGEEGRGWAASGPLAGGGGGGKGGFEEKKARGTGRRGLLRGVMPRSAMAAAADGGGGVHSLSRCSIGFLGRQGQKIGRAHV